MAVVYKIPAQTIDGYNYPGAVFTLYSGSITFPYYSRTYNYDNTPLAVLSTTFQGVPICVVIWASSEPFADATAYTYNGKTVYARYVEGINGATFNPDLTTELKDANGISAVNKYCAWLMVYGGYAKLIASYTELTETADAIREKTGDSSPIEWEEGTGFADAIDAIQTELPTQTKSVTPTESAQTVTPDAGYALSEVDVGAISSTYVGSGIARKSSSDLSASGATVTAPAGYYDSAASKAVASGTQGTPSISVSSDGLITASCTDTTGYITGTTKTATQQMTARTSSDLTASGATVTAPAGYYNAAASKAVASGTAGTPTATKGTVSNHSISVTPSVTNATGYITGSTKTGTAVSVSASELVSGTKSISANGTGIDVTNYAAVNVAVPTGEGEYSWLGLYGELVDDALYSVSGTLSSTNFPSWTPSTSSATMVNPQTAKSRAISDMDNYEYVAVWEAKVDLTYNSGSVNKSKPLYTRSLLTQHIFRRPGTWNSIQSKTFDTNACAASEIVNFCYGYNHNSSLSYVWQYTTTYKYCCWLGGEDATFSSSTGNATVTFKSPRIYVSCDSYYFSTTNAGYVNPASSTYSIKGKLFRIKRDGFLRGGVGLVADMINGHGW